jgi:phosphatidylglycerophosphate synthase
MHAFMLTSVVGLAGLLACNLALFSDLTRAELGISSALYIVFSGIVFVMLARTYDGVLLGWANIATFARGILAIVLATSLFSADTPHGLLFAIALAALALDGIDGWVARRQGLASGFGARFDMEADSILAAVLALLVFAEGHAGPLVLGLGVARYLFFAAMAVWPWLDRPLPERLSRKSICVVQLALLVLLQLPLLPRGAADMLVSVVILALIWSFGRDILWLRARR